MKYLYLHSADRRVAIARGIHVFERWRRQDRHVYMSSQLSGGVWEFIQEGNVAVLVDLPAVEAWVRFVEEAAISTSNVVLIDVHHPVWRPDLQIHIGPDAEASHSTWNHPVTIGLIERCLKAADGVITPRLVWGDVAKGQLEYNQRFDLEKHNRYVNEIADVRAPEDGSLFEIELEMAFKDAMVRKGLA